MEVKDLPLENNLPQGSDSQVDPGEGGEGVDYGGVSYVEVLKEEGTPASRRLKQAPCSKLGPKM